MSGSVDHPMLAEHWIEWIALETTAGVQCKALAPAWRRSANSCLRTGTHLSPLMHIATCTASGARKHKLGKSKITDKK